MPPKPVSTGGSAQRISTKPKPHPISPVPGGGIAKAGSIAKRLGQLAKQSANEFEPNYNSLNAPTESPNIVTSRTQGLVPAGINNAKQVGKDYGHFREQNAKAVDQWGQQVGDEAAGLGGDIKNLGHSVADYGKGQVNRAVGNATGLGGDIKNLGGSMADYGQSSLNQLKGEAGRGLNSINENYVGPAAAGAGAFGGSLVDSAAGAANSVADNAQTLVAGGAAGAKELGRQAVIQGNKAIDEYGRPLAAGAQAGVKEFGNQALQKGYDATADAYVAMLAGSTGSDCGPASAIEQTAGIPVGFIAGGSASTVAGSSCPAMGR